MVDDDGGGTIPMDEFLMGCLRLRGQARAVDAARSFCFCFLLWHNLKVAPKEQHMTTQKDDTNVHPS